MKKLLLFFTAVITQFAFTQNLAFKHDFNGTKIATGFTVNSPNSELQVDQFGNANNAINLSAGHGSMYLDYNSQTALRRKGSISFWYKHNSVLNSSGGGNYPLLFFTNGASTSYEGIMLGVNSNGSLIFGSSTGGQGTSSSNFSYVSTPFTYYSSDWHYYTVAYGENNPTVGGDPYIMKLYIDGQLRGTKSFYNVLASADPRIHFGSFSKDDTNAGTPTVAGIYDNIKVHSDVLSATQALNLYNTEAMGIQTPAIYEHKFENTKVSPSFFLGDNLTLTTDKLGNANSAIQLPNNHQKLRLNYSANGSNLAARGTISFWYKHDGHINGNGINTSTFPIFYVPNGYGSYHEGIALAYNPSTRKLRFGSSSSGTQTTTVNEDISFTPNDDWHFYTITYYAGTLALYVDGNLRQSRAFYPLTGTNANSVRTMFFGSFNSTTNQVNEKISTYGKFDEIKVYNHGVSSEQASQLYQDATYDCNVNIPDANFKNALLTHGPSIDINYNGVIQCSEATAFTGTIIVDSKNISDITGIEAFTNINTLSVTNNQITSIDVSANTKLTGLYAYQNNLSSLNLANGNNTNMTSLFVINNPNLKCIQVDNAAYSNANWIGNSFQKPADAIYSENCTTQPACTVLIPDVKFKTALLNHTPVIDTNNDGEIQCSEAEAAEKLRIYYENIIDLTGIEAFTNLKELFVSNNQLTSLDLSANTKLQYLSCFNNQLSSLDLSANTALYGLDCSSNFLTSLDVSANPALVSLVCFGQPLTSLNIANGNNHQMYTMDAHNTNLTCIQVDNAAYSNANWTGNDFRKPTGASYSEDCSGTMSVSDWGTKGKISAYPNPTKDTVKLSENADVQVFDASGKMIKSYKNTSSVDLTGQNQGIYILKTANANGIQTVKVIKK